MVQKSSTPRVHTEIKVVEGLVPHPDHVLPTYLIQMVPYFFIQGVVYPQQNLPHILWENMCLIVLPVFLSSPVMCDNM